MTKEEKREYMREWRKKNREHVNSYLREYRQKNRDVYLAQKRAWGKANYAKKKAASRG